MQITIVRLGCLMSLSLAALLHTACAPARIDDSDSGDDEEEGEADGSTDGSDEGAIDGSGEGSDEGDVDGDIEGESVWGCDAADDFDPAEPGGPVILAIDYMRVSEFDVDCAEFFGENDLSYGVFGTADRDLSGYDQGSVKFSYGEGPMSFPIPSRFDGEFFESYLCVHTAPEVIAVQIDNGVLSNAFCVALSE